MRSDSLYFRRTIGYTLVKRSDWSAIVRTGPLGILSEKKPRRAWPYGLDVIKVVQELFEHLEVGLVPIQVADCELEHVKG